MPQYGLNLRDYLRVLRRRKTIVIFTTLMLGFFSFVLATLQKPIPLYQATASVKIERTSTLAGLYLETISWSPEDYIATQMEIIKSYPVVERVAKEMGYIDKDLTSEEIKKNNHYVEIILKLKNQVTVSREGLTNIVDITATSTDPDEAQHLANTVAAVYREENIREKNSRTLNARKFIEHQLEVVEKKLRKAEEAVQAYREKNKLVTLDQAASQVLNQLTHTEDRFNEVKREWEDIVFQIERLRKQRNLPKEVQREYFAGLDHEFKHPEVVALSKRLTDLYIERDLLLHSYTNDHPQVKAIEAKIDKLSNALLGELIALEQRLRVRKEELEKEVERLREEYRALPQSGLTLARLEEEVRLNRQVYSQLQSTYQQALIKEAEMVEEVSIVRPALKPTYPINPPKTKATTSVGVVIGFILGVVLAFVWETLDTSIGAIEDVEKFLNTPVVGLIPHTDIEEIKARILRKREAPLSEELVDMQARLVCHFAPKSPLAESYRALRTNVQFITLEQEAKTFLITSSSLGEGKTTVAVNLATTMAQAGLNTLLVDADLRKPMIHRIFGIEREPGLTEIILGNYQWRDVLRTVTDIMMGKMSMEEVLATPGIDNLDIITAGKIPPNPSELLSSKRFVQFIARVRDEYDAVIFDCTPVLPATDAAILGSRVDGIILLYYVGKIARGALRRTKVQLENVKGRVLGVVLNGLRAEVSPDYVDLKYGYYGTERGVEPGRKGWSSPLKSLFKRREILEVEGMEEEEEVPRGGFAFLGKIFKRSLTVTDEAKRDRGRIIGLIVIVLILVVGTILWRTGLLPSGFRSLYMGQVPKAVVGKAPPPGVTTPSSQPVAQAPKPSASPAEGYAYAIHLSSYQESDVAQRDAERWRKAGYEAFVWGVDLPGRGRWYRVLVSRFGSEGEALAVAEELKASGRTDYVRVMQVPLSVVSRRVYSIHLSSYRGIGVAQRDAERWRKAGYEAFVWGVDLPGGGRWYRVLVGRFESREEALAIAEKLRTSGRADYARVMELGPARLSLARVAR